MSYILGGVIHHTGQMWKGLDLIFDRIAQNGQFVVSIYNDEGRTSRNWTRIKKAYTKLPGILRPLIVIPCFIYLWWRVTLVDILKGHPFHTWRTYGTGRGMSPWHDVIDWVGGYPFEVATPDELFAFYYKKGMQLQKMKTCNHLGCNEFVFKRSAE